MRKFGVVVGAVALVVVLSAGAAGAASFTFSFDSSEGSFGDEGTLLELAEQPTPGDLVGRSCTVILDVGNNESVRQGSDVVIASGDASVELPNVEAQPGDAGPKQIGTIVVGASVTASVRFGPEEAFSATGVVVLDCPEPIPPTPPGPPTPAGIVVVNDVTPASAVVGTARFTG
jgi:hypothetical protein